MYKLFACVMHTGRSGSHNSTFISSSLFSSCLLVFWLRGIPGVPLYDLHKYMSRAELQYHFGVQSLSEVPDYDLFAPSYELAYESFPLRARTNPRLVHPAKLQFQIRIFDQNYTLSGTRNDHLVTADFRVDYFGESFEQKSTLHPSMSATNRHYQALVSAEGIVEQGRAVFSTTSDSGLHGVVEGADRLYRIKPVKKGVIRRYTASFDLSPDQNQVLHVVYPVLQEGWYRTRRVRRDAQSATPYRYVDATGHQHSLYQFQYGPHGHPPPHQGRPMPPPHHHPGGPPPPSPHHGRPLPSPQHHPEGPPPSPPHLRPPGPDFRGLPPPPPGPNHHHGPPGPPPHLPPGQNQHRGPPGPPPPPLHNPPSSRHPVRQEPLPPVHLRHPDGRPVHPGHDRVDDRRDHRDRGKALHPQDHGPRMPGHPADRERMHGGQPDDHFRRGPDNRGHEDRRRHPEDGYGERRRPLAIKRVEGMGRHRDDDSDDGDDEDRTTTHRPTTTTTTTTHKPGTTTTSPKPTTTTSTTHKQTPTTTATTHKPTTTTHKPTTHPPTTHKHATTHKPTTTTAAHVKPAELTDVHPIHATMLLGAIVDYGLFYVLTKSALSNEKQIFHILAFYNEVQTFYYEPHLAKHARLTFVIKSIGFITSSINDLGADAYATQYLTNLCNGPYNLPEYDHLQALTMLDMFETASKRKEKRTRRSRQTKFDLPLPPRRDDMPSWKPGKLKDGLIPEDQKVFAAVGLALLGSTCSKQHHCSVVEMNSFTPSISAAHELGHALGMNHEGSNGCAAMDSLTSFVVPTQTMKSGWTEFAHLPVVSKCAIQEMVDYLKGEGRCLVKPAPADVDKMFKSKLHETLTHPFTADQVCKLKAGPLLRQMHKWDSQAEIGAENPHDAVICKSLHCYGKKTSSSPDKLTGWIFGPAPVGTQCDHQGAKFCFNFQCVDKAALPKHIFIRRRTVRF